MQSLVETKEDFPEVQLWGGAISYGGKLCSPILLLTVGKHLTCAIQQRFVTLAATGEMNKKLGLCKLSDGRIVFTSSRFAVTKWNFENPQLSSSEENWGPIVAPFLPAPTATNKEIQELYPADSCFEYLEMTGQSSDWNKSTKIRLVSIPLEHLPQLFQLTTSASTTVWAQKESTAATSSLLGQAPMRCLGFADYNSWMTWLKTYFRREVSNQSTWIAEGDRLKANLRRFVRHFSQAYLRQNTREATQGGAGGDGIPPVFSRTPIKYVASLNQFIHGKGLMPGGKGALAPLAARSKSILQDETLTEDERTKRLASLNSSSSSSSFCALEVMNHDVTWQVLTFLSGTRLPNLSFRGAVSWSSDWHAGPLLYFEDHIGEDLRATVVQPVVNGNCVGGAQWKSKSGGIRDKISSIFTHKSSDTWTLSWSWDDNSDASRQTKPHSAEVEFNREFSSFYGSCTFPGEGALGFAGAIPGAKFSTTNGKGFEVPKHVYSMDVDALFE